MTKQPRGPLTLLQVPSRLLAWAPRALLLVLHPRPRAQHSPGPSTGSGSWGPGGAACLSARFPGTWRGSLPEPGPVEKGEPATRSLETTPSSAGNDTLSTAERSQESPASGAHRGSSTRNGWVQHLPIHPEFSPFGLHIGKTRARPVPSLFKSLEAGPGPVAGSAGWKGRWRAVSLSCQPWGLSQQRASRAPSPERLPQLSRPRSSGPAGLCRFQSSPAWNPSVRRRGSIKCPKGH